VSGRALFWVFYSISKRLRALGAQRIDGVVLSELASQCSLGEENCIDSALKRDRSRIGKRDKLLTKARTRAEYA
jgi:hypothetical protein